LRAAGSEKALAVTQKKKKPKTHGSKKKRPTGKWHPKWKGKGGPQTRFKKGLMAKSEEGDLQLMLSKRYIIAPGRQHLKKKLVNVEHESYGK